MGVSPKPAVTKEKTSVGSGATLLSGSRDSDEAIAAASIISFKLRADLQRQDTELVNLACAEADIGHVSELVAKGRAVIIIFSSDTLNSLEQLGVMAMAMKALSLKAARTFAVVPVTLPDFIFPTPAYYSDTLPKISPGGHDQLNVSLKAFFKIIAIALVTHASDQSLHIQCNQVLLRVPTATTASIANAEDLKVVMSVPEPQIVI